MKKFRLKKYFSAAHFYNQPEWDIDKNREVFGKCFSEYGHGHDYVCEIEFSAEEMESLDSIFSEILETLDHQHLNFMIPHFKALVPTTENLALYIQKQIHARLGKRKTEVQLLELRLFETPDIWVELKNYL